MAFKYNRQLVLSNLVLHLDASIKASYPGTGNKWYDISKNNNHFTLENSPTWNGTRLTFDGTNDYAIADSSETGNFGTGNFTIEYVVNYGTTFTGLSGYRTIIMKRFNIVAIGNTNSNGWAHRIGANAFFIQDSSQDDPNNQGLVVNNDPSSITSQNITHVVQTLNNNGSTMVGRLYKNGVLLNTSTLNYSAAYGGDGNVSNSSKIQLMSSISDGSYLQGDLYAVRLYNKELSAAEVLNNYNISRIRFGF